MNIIIKNKKRIIIGVVIAAVLTAALFFGSPSHKAPGSDIPPASSAQAPQPSSAQEAESSRQQSDAQSETYAEISKAEAAPDTRESSVKPESSLTAESSITSAASESADPISSEPEPQLSSPQTVTVTTVTQQPGKNSEASETGKPQTSSPAQTSSAAGQQSIAQPSQEESRAAPSSEEKNYAHTCTIFISCETAVRNDKLSRAKRSVLPENGIVYAKGSVGLRDGESAFDVLKRVCSENRIHLDFSTIPMTGGAYIKGINNLYEFDCGNVSGWMYRVNGEYPNVGCSDYKLSPGDEVEFLYSCDLGADIGNIYMGG